MRKALEFGNVRAWRGMVLAAVVLLTGCASTLSARVTSYQQWPANAQGSTYRIMAAPTQTNNLEFDAIADMVRASIGPVGLVEAQSPGTARFTVSLEYGTTRTQTWTRSYDDYYLNDGWGFGPAFGGFYGGGWGGGGIFMSSYPRDVPVNVYANALTVVIKDNSNNQAEVYRSTAVHNSYNDSLIEVMPYLAQAVFDNFPGNNGQTREVRYQLSR
jgi:hypothetical protein